MAGFNQCVFVGRVGIDPQRKETNEGVSYCRFRFAVDQGKDEPLGLSVVTWRSLATQVEKYVKKGSLVLVSGRLSVDTYTDKDNRKQTSVEIVALDVRFLDRSPKQGVSRRRNTQALKQPQTTRQPKRQRLCVTGAGEGRRVHLFSSVL